LFVLRSSADVEYSADKSFSGRFTEVNMYRGVIADTAVDNFSKCRPYTGQSVVVDWNVNAFDGNEIDVEDVSNDVLCASKILEQKAVFNHGTSHNQVHLACEKLGGVRLGTHPIKLSTP
jgi:hypothetical protein